MEISEKTFARQKFRSSRGRGRAFRGSAQRGGLCSGPARPNRDLDSNAYRYEDDTDKEDDGNVAPKSQGADLEALIEDADVLFNQAFYRFRTQLHDITAEVPPLGAANQLLAIDLEALASSLSVLPLHTLLGLEPQYLQGVALDIERKVQNPPSHSRPTAAPTPQAPTVTQGTPCNLSARASKPCITPTADVNTQHQPLLTMSTLGGPAPAPASAPAAVPPLKVVNATSAAAVAGDAFMSAGVDAEATVDDDELKVLLMGCVPRPAQTTHSSVLAGRTAGPVAASGIGPAWPAMLPVLASVIPTAKATMKPAGLQVRAQMHAGAPGLAPQVAEGQNSSTAGEGPGRRQGSDSVTPAASGTSVVGSEPAPGGASLPVTSHLSRQGPATAASLVETTGVVRVSHPGSAVPAAATVLSPSTGTPAPRPTVWPAARTVTPTGFAAAGSKGPARSQVGGQQLVVSGQVTTMAPANMLAQRKIPAAVTAAGASTSGSGEPEKGVVDDELRLLLGLPLEAGGPSKSTASATAVTQPMTQLQPYLALKAATVTTMPPAARKPSAQQEASKSLDEWLNSL